MFDTIFTVSLDTSCNILYIVVIGKKLKKIVPLIFKKMFELRTRKFTVKVVVFRYATLYFFLYARI